MIESALIGALLPGAVEAVKGLFKAGTEKWIGLTVDDRIKLQNADIARLEALAKLDNPGGTPSQWVIDLRGSFRYLACGFFIVGGLSTIWVAPALAPLGIEAATVASSFIFGERMMLSLANYKTK